MLVLTRRSGEELVIPEHGIVFTILDVQGDRVRVGISAPADVGLYRRELWQRMEQSNAVDGAVLYGEKSGNPKRKA
jgi:carbon storage regulator